MLDRLSVADAMTLHAGSATAPNHSVGVLVLEASADLSHPRLQQLVGSALPRLARFRSRLVAKPMGMGKPVWAEIDGHDPFGQVHAATVSAPGGVRELAALVTKLTAEEQNWRRSLWQAWTIDGLAAGRWAVVVTMSPVLGENGDGFAAVWQRLITAEPASDDAARPEDGPGPAPSTAELVSDAVAEMIENNLTGAWLAAEAVTASLLAMRRRLNNAEEGPDIDAVESSMCSTAPRRLFNAPLTRRRSTAFASIRLADARVVSSAFGGSTVDVVLAACTLALRSWLLRYDAVPRRPLLLAVPLSMPADAARQVRPASAGRVPAPVHLDDPVQVLSSLHTATQRLSYAHRDTAETAGPSIDLATALSLLPPWMTQAGNRLSRILGLSAPRPPNRHGSVTFAARPGRGFCAGSSVAGVYVIEPLVQGCGLNIGAFSHADVVDLCVTCCPDDVPDVEYLASGITDAVDVLLAAAAKSPRGEGRSVVTEITSRTGRRS